MAFHVGTSGWAYPSWKPGFYPEKLPAKKFLEHYATRLSSVEVNYTFRSLPSEAMLSGWLAATGPDFAFSFKAPQRITHFSRLKNCAGLVADFHAALAPALRANKLGVTLFQLPPNLKADPALLDNFLADARQPGFRPAFEFRHESWFVDEVFAVLRRHQAALCVAESDELESPDIATAPFRCYRLRKSEYAAEELANVAARMRAAASASEGGIFLYFKHEESPVGALNAAALLRELSQA
jgi:uncharacterized protein YecE (DUF72 family)